MSLPEVKNPPLGQRLFCRTMPMEQMNYSNPVPPCPGQEPMDFKNPSPPTPEMQFSPSNVTKKKSDKISSPLQLFKVENQFSRMKIKIESLVQGDNFHGFAKFIRANEHNMLSCWEEQKIRSEMEKNAVVDTPVAVVDTPSTQIKGENDGCLDPHASHRCRRFLKGKKCQDKCTKLHRLPKEDGIKCLSEQYKQCHLGKKCIFVHENDSDTDSEPDSSSTLNLPPNNIAVPSCSSNPVKSEVGVKRKEVNDVELPCNKKIKQEKDCLPPSSFSTLIPIKPEPAEVDIYKHEAIDYPVKQEEKILTDMADTSSLLQERVTNDLIISVPDGYQSVSEELLSQVSTMFFEILGQIGQLKFPVKSESSYVALIEFLQHHNIPVLAETRHDKLFIWDVHLRLALCALLDVNEAKEYLENIENNLLADTFGNYLKCTLEKFNH